MPQLGAVPFLLNLAVGLSIANLVSVLSATSLLKSAFRWLRYATEIYLLNLRSERDYKFNPLRKATNLLAETACLLKLRQFERYTALNFCCETEDTAPKLRKPLLLSAT
jgi:hypothetical protein